MLCPKCHGTGFLEVHGQRLPCDECYGFGTLHCCDGLTEQPGPETVNPSGQSPSKVTSQTITSGKLPEGPRPTT